ncbi:V-type proton ATPase subunit S1 [Hyposmocoma kahamanoa]|uniref:V-type proton ATPase subunit S1 n=1 Tax=Hyposmocoma kahamanoa TaxID=1477025 RepID=UPI000E6D71AC|nr:V-type proton ATPase subunit S1 [Hyposmocoma kahamanoa]
MAYCRLASIIVVFSVVQCIATVQVPVFLWGNLAQVSQKSNPLTKVTFPEFGLLLKHELQKDPFTVIFIEETLSVEDFSLKNNDGESSFPYLHSIIGNALYIPSVENPLRVLNKLADPENVDHIKLTENGLSADIVPQSGKYLFINLKDAQEGESRSDLLRRHNDFMQSTLENLSAKYNSIVSIYTAHYPSWTVPMSRMKRQTQAQTNDYHISGLRIYFSRVIFNNGYGESNLTYAGSGESVFNDGTQNSTLLFNDNTNVTLNFVSKGGYWMFNSIEVKLANDSEYIPATTEVYALLDNSYRCGQNVTFSPINVTRSYSLVFQDLKVQPYFNVTETVPAWGESFNCVGFFSAPIWAGLFVVAILLSITFYGIMMMMDIKTMDRFDDPKGKTITINSVD